MAGKKRKKEKNKSRSLRPILRIPLIIIFLAIFFLMGKAILSADIFGGEGEPPAEDSVKDKLDRLVFLRQAVKERTKKENYVKLDNIAPELRQAVVAVEDGRFYSHGGIDAGGIIRAAAVNVESGKIEEGASTITQQLIKNLFLNSERTFDRKAEEIILAVDMEMNYSKDEILELYLNTIYFGSGFYGVGDATEGYFGKRPADLNLAESSMLAGVPNAPSLYSPYVDFIMAKKRQIIVLDAMVDKGFIDKAAAENAKIRPIMLKSGKAKSE